MPGAPPGVGLPGTNAAMVRRWAEQAVRRLDDLHAWTPTAAAARALQQSPVHEGFTSCAALITEIEGVLAADRAGLIARPLIDGLAVLAENSPTHAATDVPVHADCDWDKWLADGRHITALLDFERARFGDPPTTGCSWPLPAGRTPPLILDVIAEQTATSRESLRAACEIRDAMLIAQDLRHALDLPDPPAWVAHGLRDLEEFVVGQRSWKRAS